MESPTNEAAPSRRTLPVSKIGVADGLPTDDAINEKTLEASPNPADIGEHTEQLSDVSEGEDEQAQRTASRHALSTWLRRIQPLVRNKRVRALAIVNTILTAINLLLFIACCIMLGFLVFEIVSVRSRTSVDKPCIYQWTEWSSCSASCTEEGAETPTKTRHVNKSTIVQARGSKYKDCPSDLAKRTDSAPCNTHKCAKPLSSFTEWIGPYKWDVASQPRNTHDECYMIRRLPIGDYLVTVDVSDLTRNVSCSEPANKPEPDYISPIGE